MAQNFDDMASMMMGMGMPGFSPIMSFNLSGTCATTRLLQIPALGLSTVDISGKFAPHKKAGSTDLEGEFWERLKAVVDNTSKRLNKKGGLGWRPVLYVYELYQGAAKSEADFGMIVFAEPTVSKFLLINPYTETSCKCGNPYHNDYSAIMNLQAQRFLNLLTLLPLPNPIKYVRATYTTRAQPIVSDQFLFEEGPFTPSKYSSVSPIVHLTPTDLVACLDEHDVALIASTCSKNKETIKEENKHLVLSQHGSGSYVPKSLPTEISRELERECASCNKLMLQSKLMRCGACKMVFYCGPACQREHWSSHKPICKLARQNQAA